MAANNQPVFPLTPKFGSVSIANADAQTVKTVYTGGSNGSRVSKLCLISTDTAPRDVGIYINAVLVGTVAAPAGCGTSSSVPPKDVFADANCKQAYFDANGNLVVDLQAGQVLGIGAPVTVTSGKTITGTCCAADF